MVHRSFSGLSARKPEYYCLAESLSPRAVSVCIRYRLFPTREISVGGRIAEIPIFQNVTEGSIARFALQCAAPLYAKFKHPLRLE